MVQTALCENRAISHAVAACTAATVVLPREMRLRVFPALPASSCCPGSNDWPLHPHEILLHPRDLETLRVPAYGYVSVSGSTSGSSGGGGAAHDGNVGGVSGGDVALTTFCRVVPDDSLAPGQTRASTWILRAIRAVEDVVGSSEHLTVAVAIPQGGKEVVVAPGTVASRVTVVVHLTDAHSAVGASTSTGDSGRGSKEQLTGVARQFDLGRAIARRCCRCLVRQGSLIAAEVLGKTAVLRVLSIVAVAEGDPSAAFDCSFNVTENAPPANGEKSSESGRQDGFVARDNDGSRHQRGRRNDEMSTASEQKISTLRLIGPNTQITVSSGAAQVGDKPRQGHEGNVRMKQDPFTRCATQCRGKAEVWGKRAPGLEVSLDELHALVLLAAEGLNGSGAAAGPCIGDVDRSSSDKSSRSATSLRVADVLPTSVLLSGPSGSGKTLALDILTDDLRERHGVHVVRLLGPQILASFSHGGDGGDNDSVGNTNASGATTGTLLGRALADAKTRAPSVLIVDELDAVFDSMGGEGDGGARLAEGARASAALLAVLDHASSDAGSGVAVVGATRRAVGGTAGAGWKGLQEGGGGGGMGEGSAIPGAFRKPGRFDRCVEIGPPTRAGREAILRVLLNMPGWKLEPLTLTSVAPKSDADVGSIKAAFAGLSEERSDGRSGFWRDGLGGRSDGCCQGDVESETATLPGNRERDENRILLEWASRLSTVTPGMVGGDLDCLVRTARARATLRGSSRQDTSELQASETLSSPARVSTRMPASVATAPLERRWRSSTKILTWQDIIGAVAVTVPRSLRGMGVASASECGGGGRGPTWASVGGFAKARRRLQRLVQWPWQHPEAFARMGISAPAGALLYGPSGCGKSLVAQVLANECLTNFMWVRSSELLSRYLGETEAKLRALFTRARAAAPCILFLDELDAITVRRGDGDGDSAGGGAGGVHSRVLSTLLNEMDGVAGASVQRNQSVSAVASSSDEGNDRRGGGAGGDDDSGTPGGMARGVCCERGEGREAGSRAGVLVLAATSRRDALDSALLRPGRLHESVEFGMPEKEDREGVLKVHARRLPLAPGVDLERLSRDDISGGLSCADLEASCRDAAMMAVRENLHGAHEVRAEHLRKALEGRVSGRLKTRFTFSVGV